IGVVLSRWWGPALVNRLGKEMWLIRASLVYQPLQQQGKFKLQASQSFSTVLNLVKQRSNFYQLAEEHPQALGGMDADRLANGLFKIEKAGAAGDNSFDITLEWEDPVQGVRLLNRLIRIIGERRRRARADVINDLLASEVQVREQKQADVENA